MNEAMADLTTRAPIAITRHAAPGSMPRADASIVPKTSIAGRALVAVIAIMTFLASLTIGGVALVVGSAGEWQAEVAREVTIQVKPAAGRDIEADVAKAVAAARATAGIADVRPFTREESAGLLEPWLGGGLAVSDLPVPRMVVVKLKSGERPDLASLRAALARDVPPATLDDHRSWVARMRTMSRSAMAVGLAIFGLVLAATILSVAFATRGAMATNRPIVEVLHFIGATDRYIANQFQRRFLVLGLRGGFFGGGAALLLFALASLLGDRTAAAVTGEQPSILFGTLSIGALGYAAILVQIVVVAVVVAVTSRMVVNRTLSAMT